MIREEYDNNIHISGYLEVSGSISCFFHGNISRVAGYVLFPSLEVTVGKSLVLHQLSDDPIEGIVVKLLNSLFLLLLGLVSYLTSLWLSLLQFPRTGLRSMNGMPER